MPAKATEPSAATGRKKGGRRLVLDERKRKQLLSVLALGCSRAAAARFVNCSPHTINYTAERDAEFQDQIARAESRLEVSSMTQMEAVGKDPKHWRAIAWLLERRFPNRYGLRKPGSVSPVQLAETIDRIVTILLEEVSKDSDRKRVVLRLEKLLSRLDEELSTETQP